MFRFSLIVLVCVLQTTFVLAQKAEFVFLQTNDVYEIAPLSGGAYGGLARVAGLYKQLKTKNPNTKWVLAGDFLSPSAIGAAKLDGRGIAGAQMVAALNAGELDLVVFGNHEFDIKEPDLLSRINESRFDWISANLSHKKGDSLKPFARQTPDGKTQPFPAYRIYRFKGRKNLEYRVAVIGLTLNFTLPAHAAYQDVYATAEKYYNLLKDSADAVVALTHLNIAEDRELARRVPNLKLIMGGHDHTNMLENAGQTRIAKADANAKTVYIHRLVFKGKKKKLTIQSELKPIDAKTPVDPTTEKAVNEWIAKADAAFRAVGLDPKAEITSTTETLDGLEASVRSKSTNLTRLVGKAVFAAADKPDLAVYNAGSIRIDDLLTGKITQYDVIRILPFGGKIAQAEIKGSVLKAAFESARDKNKGNGGWLQYENVAFDETNNVWLVGGQPLDENRVYRVALTEFLLTGKEKNLAMLGRDQAGVNNVVDTFPAHDPRNDIRLALVEYLKKHGAK